MKKLIILTALFISLNCQAQSDVAVWDIIESNDDPDSEEGYIIFSVTLDDAWYLYASDFSAPIGPLPTVVDFESNKSYQLINTLESTKPQRAFDPSWDLAYTYFSSHGEFRQQIKFNSKEAKIKGVIRGQYFHKLSSKKLDFEKQFEVIINPKSKKIITQKIN